VVIGSHQPSLEGWQENWNLDTEKIDRSRIRGKNQAILSLTSLP